MSTSQLKFPFVSVNLQRWDAADQALLTDYTSALVRECLKDVVVGDALGRVFKGFQPVVNVPNKTVTFSGEGVAVDKDGNLLVAISSFNTVLSLTGLAATKQFYVFAYAKPVIDTVNKADRKIWNTSTTSESQASVPVFKDSVINVVVSDAYTIAPNNVSGCPVSYVDPLDGNTYTTLPLASFNTDGSAGIVDFRDIRKMYAVDGNVEAGVTGLLTELPHDFTNTDKTLGIRTVRDFFKAIVSRVKDIVGKPNWYDAPDPISLSSIYGQIGPFGSGVNRVPFVSSTASLPATPNNRDIVWYTTYRSLYVYDSSSTQGPDTGGWSQTRRVLKRDALLDTDPGRWFLLGSGYGLLKAVNGVATLDANALLEQDVRPNSIGSNKLIKGAYFVTGVVRITRTGISSYTAEVIYNTDHPSNMAATVTVSGQGFSKVAVTWDDTSTEAKYGRILRNLQVSDMYLETDAANHLFEGARRLVPYADTGDAASKLGQFSDFSKGFSVQLYDYPNGVPTALVTGTPYGPQAWFTFSVFSMSA